MTQNTERQKLIYQENMVVVCVELHGEMTNGNDVTQNTKHTNLSNKKHLLRTLFLQPTCQRVLDT